MNGLSNEKRSGIEFLKNPYFRAVDYWLIIPVLLLSAIGLFVLNDVYSYGILANDYPQNIYRQAGAAFVGAAIALVICLIETHFIKLLGWITYWSSIFLLLLVPFDGYSLRDKTGADAWVKIPLINMTFQPSELTKIGLAIVIAFLLQDMTERKVSAKKGILMMAGLYLLPIALIQYHPDTGTQMVIVFSLCCMLFVWGVKYRYIFLAISGAVVASPFVFFNLLSGFQQNRILSVFFQGADPANDYNREQSMAAIASGGLTGSTSGRPISVPIKESDFIFSAVSEQMGFIGTTAVILLAFFFLLRCLYIASRCEIKAHSYIVMGLMGVFAFHYIENMGMAIGLLPITGIPLPFISGGGTALMMNFISVGIIMNISMFRSLRKP